MLSTKELTDSKTEEYTKLFNKYYPLIFSSIYSKLGNYDESEDICQEVFIRFYQKFDEVESPRKWLYGVMRNVIMDHFKKKKKTKNDVDVDSMFDNISMSFVNGFRDTRIIIEEALNEIYGSEDEELIILFDLIAVHNFSYVQASKHLNLSYKKVRYRFNKMVDEISDYLKKKGIYSLEDLL